MAINILLADDHLMIREGIKNLLELDKNIKVIAEASDGYECLNLVNKIDPDIVLMDINMPNLDGLKVLSIMRENNINNKVIILTIHREMDYLIKAIDMGCNGFVLKDSDVNTLKKAIYEVNQGGLFIEPNLTLQLNANLALRDVDRDRLDDLTKREIEVLKLIAKGLLNKEIAIKLEISERTVKNHISNIFKKIGVADRTQAAIFAIKNDLITF